MPPKISERIIEVAYYYLFDIVNIFLFTLNNIIKEKYKDSIYNVEK